MFKNENDKHNTVPLIIYNKMKLYNIKRKQDK